MIEVSESQFTEQILLRSFDKPVAVLFSAQLCAPCKVVKPRIGRLAALYDFNVVSVDAGVDKALAGFYGVRAVPTLAVFFESKVVASVAGADNLGEADLVAFLNANGFNIVMRQEGEF